MLRFLWRSRTHTTTPSVPLRQRFQTQVGNRRFLNAPYVLPKDMRDVNRLDFQHFMLRRAMRGNYLAPIDSPHSILDSACGTGRWCVEMGEKFPDANVIGLDLNPLSALPSSARPANVILMEGDITRRLPFDDHTFDFVHQRLVAAALPATSWPFTVKELVRVCQPGAWVELVDIGWPRGGRAMRQICAWGDQVSRARGIDIGLGARIETYAWQAGLENVRKLILPIGYGKQKYGRIGDMMWTNFQGIIAGISKLAIAEGIATQHDYDRAMLDIQAEVMRGECVSDFVIVTGQKPLPGNATRHMPALLSYMY